jgi:flavin-dependent dehydrogenase
MFDVIVVGAGPAGSVAATILARGGARVLLVDRAAFPRDKLCGDTINPGTLDILHRLELDARLASGALPLDGMLVTGERGVRVRCTYGDGIHALALPRRELDFLLVQGAIAAGARFEQQVLVRGPLVEQTGRRVRVRGLIFAGPDGRDVRVPAPLVIAADGRESRIAKALGLSRHPSRPRRWAVGMYYEGVGDVQPFGEMHVRRGHYLGVAPLPSGLTNVCLVTAHREGLHDPAAVVRDVIRADSHLRDRFGAARVATPPSVLGPLAVDTSAAGVPGLLLAGDAAGFIDPMTGDGLRFAIRGAELAARFALASLAGRVRAPHAKLARARDREFGGKWRFNRSVRWLVSRGLAVELAGLVTAAAPWMLRRAIAYAADIPRR